MAKHNFRYCSELKVTFLNDSVYRSKRSFEGSEEGHEPSAKRQHLSKHCSKPFLVASVPSSSDSGVVTSPVRSVTVFGGLDVSDFDDSLLEASDGENEGSLPELSREDEDKLLYSSDSDLETSTSETSSVFFTQNGPLLCTSEGDVSQKSALNPENDLNTISHNQAGLGLGSDCSANADTELVEASLLNLEKESDTPGITGESAQTSSSSSQAMSQLVAENHSEEQHIPTNRMELVSETGSNPLCNPAREATSDTYRECPSSAFTSDSDRREAHVEDAYGAEWNRPPVPDPSSVRPRKRINIDEGKLKNRMKTYIQAVLAHACGNEHILDEVKEMYALMQDLHHENHFQEPRPKHPTDLTQRNYMHRTDKARIKLTLPQWVDKCGRNYRRFENISNHFKRSPLSN